MSKTKKINLFIFSLFFLFSIKFFLPQLRSPQFNLIDDGHSLQTAHDLVNYPKDWREILIGREMQVGRMRPLYYIYYFVLYLIAGANPLIFWIGQLFSLVVTVYLVYLVIDHFLKKPILSALSSLPIFFLPSVVENFLRLGPAEARQMIWILWGVLAFLKFIDKKIHKLVSAIPLFLLWLIPVFIKETSFIFLVLYGLIFTFLAISKINRKSWSLVGASFLLIIATYLILPKGGTGYSSALSFNFFDAKDNFFIVRIVMSEFWWLLMVSSIFWGANLLGTFSRLNKKFKIKLAKELLIFGAALSYTLLPLFWPHQLERYYYPSQILVLIFFVTQVYQFTTWIDLEKTKHKLFFISIIILIPVLSKSIFVLPSLRPKTIATRYSNQRKIWYEQYQYSGALISYLLNKNLDNYEVAVTHNDYEVIYETALYAANFDFKKSDLIILNENPKIEDRFGQPFSSYEDLEKEILTLGSPSIIIRRGNYTDQDLVLWPDDKSLNDPKQVWSITEKTNE